MADNDLMRDLPLAAGRAMEHPQGPRPAPLCLGLGADGAGSGAARGGSGLVLPRRQGGVSGHGRRAVLHESSLDIQPDPRAAPHLPAQVARAGAFALVWHHCVRPTELDVYVHGLQGPKPAVGKLLRSESAEYNRCLTRLGAGKTARDKALTLAEQASAVTRLSLLPAQPAPTADSSAAPPLSPAALRRAASVTSCTWRGSAVGPTG